MSSQVIFQQLSPFYGTNFCLKNNKFFQILKTLKENCQRENPLQMLRKNRMYRTRHGKNNR